MRLLLALVLPLLLAPPAGLAGEPDPTPRRRLAASRRSGAISVDGRLDEPAWAAAAIGEGFLQVQPDEGREASVATRVRVLWDEESLFVGVECSDPEEPTLLLNRRDREVEGDSVSVVIDPALDRRTAHRFTVHAAGQQVDGLHFDDTGYGTEWDAAWESAVARTAGGWSVELRIPLRALRLPDGAEAMGFDVVRVLARRHEESHWQFVPRGVPGVVSRLGILTGLAGIRAVRALDLRPYFASRAALAFPAAPATAAARWGACSSTGLSPSASAEACLGLDLKLALTSDLSLIGAVNPDFGQVEADQRVLNLTTFETFLPEKRPFFSEGLDLFQPPVRMTDWGGQYGGDAFQLFYSRRVGSALSPPALADGVSLLGLQAARPVATALKLLGTVGPGTVALLSTLEPSTSAEVIEAGARSDLRVAEAAHSAALRARAPLADGALLGLTATARDPLFAPGQRHAHAGAVDLVLFDGERDWSLSSQVAGSHLSGGPPELVPDGTVLGSGATGWAAQARLAKDGGPLTGFADLDLLSPAFEVNGLGFERRGNLFRGLAAIALHDLHPSARWQKAALTLSGREIRDASLATSLYRDLVLQPEVTLGNFWTLLADAAWVPSRGDDRELGDGTPLRQRGGFGGALSATTDATRPLSATLDLAHFAFGPGSFTDALLTFTLRPASRVEAHLELAYDRVRGEVRRIRGATTVPSSGSDPAPLDPQAAPGQERLYLLAPQSADSFSALLRATLALSPRLTLQAYAQLFAAGVSYGAPLRAVVPAGRGEVRVEALQPALAADGAPASDQRQAGLDVNLILRWEWRLGSILYLVYAHHAAAAVLPAVPAPLSVREDLRALEAAPRGDSLLLKIDLLAAL